LVLDGAYGSNRLLLYLKFFVGLFAIINPLGLLPVFVSLTGHMSPEERRRPTPPPTLP
jgi:small neutral amino acid transporter SnatA (MarC family)